MDFIITRFKLLLFFSLIITVFFACTKITDTNIGAGLLPPVDGVNTKDTILNIITKNKSFDTVNVGFSDDHVLGYISNDPVFGTTKASVNFQVSPPFVPLTFSVSKDSLVFDSVILSLHYTGVYGDSTSHLSLRVYEMDAENIFRVDSSYNNTVSFEKGIELTPEAKDVNILTLDDPDTLKAFGENITNQVRIPLNASFGEKLLTQFDDTNAYQDDSTFNAYFRGFIIEPDQQGNALIKISLSDTSTRLSLYYHYTTTTGTVDTTVLRFSASALNNASSNTITRNYNGTDIPKYFSSNSNAQDSLIYIQTSPGTYATLSIPGLDTLPNMIVHRAEILMSQVPDATIGTVANFTAPNLFLSAYTPDSMKRFAIPYDVTFSSGTISNLTSFGVLPIKKSDGTSTYSFDISRYVQGIVTRKDTVYNLALWAPYNGYISDNTSDLANNYYYPIASPSLNAVAIGRVMLGGGNNSKYKMRLHIVYSAVQ